MNIEELKNMSAEEVQTSLQARYDEFKEKVSGIDDVEELKKIELDIDAEQEEFDKYLREVSYELGSEDLEFDGKKYNPVQIAKKINFHINRIEQPFEYCLGLHSLVVFWNSRPTTISYGIYDSTLRLLGGLKYKGDSEWCDILVINNYLANCREGYMRDRTALTLLAELRNLVVNRIQLCSKPADETPADNLDAE